MSTWHTYLEQKILSADPIELIQLLYDAAVSEVREARRHLAAGDVERRCAAITKACDIFTELKSSLDHEKGGELSNRLDGLYGYILCRLLDANLRKDDAPLAEVLGLISTLNEGWRGIAVPPAPAVNVASYLLNSDPAEQGAQNWSL
jgi:flagellar protein FliS